MHRELRILILAFVLVVGPAVTLTWLAGRVIAHWSLILESQLERSASRAVEQTSAVLVRNTLVDCDVLRKSIERGWNGPGRWNAVVNAVAAFRAAHPWCRDVYVTQSDGTRVYPPDAFDAQPTLSLGGERPLYRFAVVAEALSQQFARTNDTAAARSYAEALATPGLDPQLAAQLRLLSAACLRRLGRSREAEHELRQVAGASVSGGTPCDAVEGFHLDLLAQQALVDLLDESGEASQALDEALALAEGVNARYPRIPALQRQAVLAFLKRRLAAMVSAVPGETAMRRRAQAMGLLDEWARAGQRSDPRRAALEAGVSLWRTASPGNERWRWISVSPDEAFLMAGTGDRLVVALATDPASLHNELESAARSEAPPATRFDLTSSFAPGDANSTRTGPVAGAQLGPPFGAYTLEARPADAAAFEAGARLQTRLYAWGAAVLALAIVIGGFLLWRISAAEIRRARTRSEFAAAVSHDLRTPLSSMRMLAESLYLGRVSDDVKRQRFLGTIINECDRLGRLTERALYFIRFGQGSLRYRLTEGDLGEVVREAAETFAAGGVDGDRHLRVQVDEPLPTVCYDAGAIEQLVLNLIDNAHKYSPDRKDIRLSVKASADRRWVILSVQDRGIGIAPAEVKQIFRAYYRGNRARASQSSGVGLGLALCRHIVRAHRGRIEVESALGEGSTFRVWLPAA